MKIFIRRKEICHISFNGVLCKELEEKASDDYISILKTVTNINLNLCTESSYIHDLEIDAVEDTFKNLRDLGFKVAVLWAEGSWPNDNNIDDQILESVAEWDKEEWGCAGHILDRPNRRKPTFHHQCVIVNLQNQTESVQCRIREYEASTEHFHDDYTPTWIKPTGAANLFEYVPSSSWDYEEAKKPYNLFNCILRTSLKKGLKVFNIGYNIRNCKVCTYPEDDIKWTEEQLFKEYSDPKIIYDIKENYPDKFPLLEAKVMSETSLYILNTETVPHVVQNDIQVMVCPCSGLHQFKFIENSLDVMEKVIWADYSYYAVKWMKIVINEWNGRDFNTFFENNKHRLDYDGTYVYGHGTWEEFLDSFSSQEQWISVWNKIRNLEHDFNVINIVNESNKIIELIPRDKNVLLQCSNIFLYESNYFNKGLDTTFNSISYVRSVQNISNKVYLNGDFNGNFYDMVNIGRRKFI